MQSQPGAFPLPPRAPLGTRATEPDYSHSSASTDAPRRVPAKRTRTAADGDWHDATLRYQSPSAADLFAYSHQAPPAGSAPPPRASHGTRGSPPEYSHSPASPDAPRRVPAYSHQAPPARSAPPPRASLGPGATMPDCPHSSASTDAPRRISASSHQAPPGGSAPPPHTFLYTRARRQTARTRQRRRMLVAE